MILVTGASGTVGRAVLEEMRKAGKPFKAMYRSEADAKSAPAGTATVLADFADRNSMNNALSGVDTVFLVCSPIPQLVELESNVIGACVANGVRHVVLNSALGAGDYTKSFPSWHRKVEDKLRASRLSHTILRPNGFFQNIVAYNAPTIRLQSAFYDSMGDARISLLDVRDVAGAAASALLAPSAHTNKTYELLGPEAVTNSDIAARLSRILGRIVNYVPIPVDAQRKAMLDANLPEWLVTAILDLQAYYVAGKCAAVTDVLPKLLSRAPITLDQFLTENKDSFRPQAAGA